MADFFRIYARQEYMTPGAAETVGIIEEVVEPGDGTLLLEVAAGKGEAAANLAGHHACQVVAVEPYDAFVHYAAAKFWHFNLRDLVSLLRADGRRLPVRSDAFDAAYCIGAPSIVGLESALAEMARAVKPRGLVIVSDVVWRSQPGELGREWGPWAKAAQTTVAEYEAAIEAAGLRVERTHAHDRKVWDEYWRPMLSIAEEAKTSSATAGADVFFADEIESFIAIERRAVEAWLGYVTFVARKV